MAELARETELLRCNFLLIPSQKAKIFVIHNLLFYMKVRFSLIFY